MKSASLFLLPLAVSAAAVENERRQLEGLLGGLLGNIVKTLPIAGSQKLEPELRPDAMRSITKWGPLELLGGNAPKPFGSFSLDARGQSFMGLFKEGICKNCAILKGKMGIQTADGSDATMEAGVYVHHILSQDTTKSRTAWVSSCGGSSAAAAAPAAGHDHGSASAAAPAASSAAANPLAGLLAGLRGAAAAPAAAAPSSTPKAATIGGAGFLGIGEDNGNTATYFTNDDGTFPSGYLMGAETGISLQIDLVNYKNTTQQIYITLDLETLPGHVGGDAVNQLMSVTGCEMKRIATQGAAQRTESSKFPIAMDGSIVYARGHLHDGGVAMELAVNGKTACTSRATYGGAGGVMIVDGQEWQTISDMSICGKPIPLKKGDYITMTSVYDSTLHPLRSNGHGGNAEVMGMFGITFVPTTPEVAAALAAASASPAAPSISVAAVSSASASPAATMAAGHSHGGK